MPTKRQYFFTKTYSEDPGTSYEKQLCSTIPTIVGALQTYDATGVIAPEFTKRGRIHYHIYCNFRNDIDYLDCLKILNRKGFCKPEMAQGNTEQVFDYITKTSYVFKHYLDNVGIDYNHDTIKLNKADTRILVSKCKRYNHRKKYPLIQD